MSIDGVGNNDAVASRPLTALETQVIGAILTDECPAADELRAQLKLARVSRAWPPTGSPSIDLEIPPDAPPAPISEAVLSMDVRVNDTRGRYTGELIVWLTDGRLSPLEYAWVTDSMPHSLPPVEELVVRRRLSP